MGSTTNTTMDPTAGSSYPNMGTSTGTHLPCLPGAIASVPPVLPSVPGPALSRGPARSGARR
jgi:hypothetical protein